jgi:hypothetical protein
LWARLHQRRVTPPSTLSVRLRKCGANSSPVRSCGVVQAAVRGRRYVGSLSDEVIHDVEQASRPATKTDSSRSSTPTCTWVPQISCSRATADGPQALLITGGLNSAHLVGIDSGTAPAATTPVRESPPYRRGPCVVPSDQRAGPKERSPHCRSSPQRSSAIAI